MATLFVTGLEFYAYHGVSDEEQILGHRYIIDLVMDVNSGTEFSDLVEESVDYGAAAQLSVEIGTKEQFRTVEKLAQTIGNALLLKFPRMMSVQVRVAKRLPPAPVIALEAGVILIVRRD